MCFLDGDFSCLPLQPDDYPEGFIPLELYLGNGSPAFEVAILKAPKKPNKQQMRDTWKQRVGGRATAVLVIVLHDTEDNKAALCGGLANEPGILEFLNTDQAIRLATAALNMPDYLAAWRFLRNALQSIESKLPGIHNVGMLATHSLQHWREQNEQEAEKTAATVKRIINKKNKDLLQALGYSIERNDNLTSILQAKDGEEGEKVALAVLLNEDESIEQASQRFNSLSPITYAMTQAGKENLPFVLMVKDSSIRLYAVEQGRAVSRRGRTEAYIECQMPMLSERQLPFLWWIFSAEALASNGTLSKLFAESQRFASDLATRLRERIYNEVMPALTRGIVEARALRNPSHEDLQHTYEMALVMLFRLLFVAYAEDRDLLPYTQNESYRRQSLTEKAKELLKQRLDVMRTGSLPAEDSGVGHDVWDYCASLFRVISEGNDRLGVPTYNGVLFSANPNISDTGAKLSKLTIDNRNFIRALEALLIAEQDLETGLVDFRSLSVREFGTIYEGLLESELALAETDMAIKVVKKKEEVYVPAKKGDDIVVRKGQIYLHDKSGVRKSTGSYYTKDFVVDYLLDKSLEPALKKHFERLNAISTDAEVAEAFFDFRVADIAMGSGHFLVAAVDRIEIAMTDYLKKRMDDRRPLTRVQKDLEDLRTAAQNALGPLKDTVDIEDSQLLRRQIARRCIYGVDLNPLAVQLATLSVWIHTFVPGLPLSLLEHNLVQGDALIGVCTIEEIKARFEELEKQSSTETQPSIDVITGDVQGLLREAEKPLRRLATIKDSTPADIEEGRRAIAEAHRATRRVKDLCDIITAQPIAETDDLRNYPFEQWLQDEQQLSLVSKVARDHLKNFETFHFPVQFPEVFISDRPGFDVILGNPPWDKVKVDSGSFWSRYEPGLKALKQREREAVIRRLKQSQPDLYKEFLKETAITKEKRKILVSPLYPGMGTGDPDLYKAFLWRFWHLTGDQEGCFGVVLPRSALNGKGSQNLRKKILQSSTEFHITTVRNKGGWLFDGIHQQYIIGLTSVIKGTDSPAVYLKGSYTDLETFNTSENLKTSSRSEEKMIHGSIDPTEVMTWNATASIPVLPSPNSLPIFRQLRQSPWLLNDEDKSSWRCFPNRELDATNDKHRMDFSEDPPHGYWPVWKGKTFGIWSPDSGPYYGYADPKKMQSVLHRKRSRSSKFRAEPEFDKKYMKDRKNLACNHARIVFQDVTNSIDHRTLIACLAPPQCFLANKAPNLIWPRGDGKDQAYLLGIMCSIPMDWYARRFVALNVNFFILEAFPVPRPPRNHPLWQRMVKLAGRLACPDGRFASWAKDVGVECGSIAPKKKDQMIYEIDALAAHLYGLSLPQLQHIFETFREGWDYKPRLEAVTGYYNKISSA